MFEFKIISLYDNADLNDKLVSWQLEGWEVFSASMLPNGLHTFYMRRKLS